MPERYTFEEVQKIFTAKNCVLQSTSYLNQTCKLEYIASCGHVNTKALKEFLNGNGIKCRNCALDIPNYEKICKTFSDKNCQVTMTSEQIQENYKNNTCKINYIAFCGHPNIVSYKNFTTLNQGINCPKCVNKNTGEKLKEFRVGENKSNLIQELNAINYFKNLIDNHFIVIKSFDGCKADIVIKKIEETEDLWLGIQVKTTIKKTEREQYYFRLNNGKYDNCLILCLCDEDKKMWLIPYEEVNGLKTIGVAKKSKYNKYEVTIENLIEKLNDYYMNISKTQFDILDTPTSIFQQQEQQYRKNREDKIKFIEFKNNTIEGLVYDFKIGDKKVQEKVGTIMHNNINSFAFNLVKYKCRIDGKCKNQCYDKGDNELYWLNCKNGKFYVIPEEELIVHGYIGKDCKEKLYLSQTNANTEWCNKYLFNYENIEKDKLLEIINK
jgi:Zn-dependent metalloprotease